MDGYPPKYHILPGEGLVDRAKEVLGKAGHAVVWLTQAVSEAPLRHSNHYDASHFGGAEEMLADELEASRG